MSAGRESKCLREIQFKILSRKMVYTLNVSRFSWSEIYWWGVISKYPIVNVTTYRHERNESKTAWLFSRDCLEVVVQVKSMTLTIYNNHFKSMMGSQVQTKNRRLEQVKMVVEILDEKWK